MATSLLSEACPTVGNMRVYIGWQDSRELSSPYCEIVQNISEKFLEIDFAIGIVYHTFSAVTW